MPALPHPDVPRTVEAPDLGKLADEDAVPCAEAIAVGGDVFLYQLGQAAEGRDRAVEQVAGRLNAFMQKRLRRSVLRVVVDGLQQLRDQRGSQVGCGELRLVDEFERIGAEAVGIGRAEIDRMMRREIGHQREDVRPAGELRELSPKGGEIAGLVAAMERARRGAGEIGAVQVAGRGFEPSAFVQRESEVVDRRRRGGSQRHRGRIALHRRRDVALGTKQHAARVVGFCKERIESNGPAAGRQRLVEAAEVAGEIGEVGLDGGRAGIERQRAPERACRLRELLLPTKDRGSGAVRRRQVGRECACSPMEDQGVVAELRAE